ncbi:hypothetical protein HOP50_04g31980 [Chloropicon primus]|uniref:Uncharacterized protein n=2 Tax=Chloropicon primus TaxID=1764295 RepID=A0A5B8MJM4_9CHLO|nr:hypothetical protein A3770_04p31940 [Chloropicon primus]UPQ99888.1 hypothetical protein HOP50_04g31980 [Chloropicon primus]|eukprot:QDZ20676.1 hypothetical protein A3770_04p31940 [Chloropicon primus]
MEDDFLEALVASERVAEWVDTVKGRANSRTEAGDKAVRSALTNLLDHVQGSQVYAEEAVLAEADVALKQALEGCEDDGAVELGRKLLTLLLNQRVKVAEGEVRAYQLQDEGRTKINLYEQALTHGVGAKVWHAAELLCEELSLPAWSAILEGKTVLELGAGCGLCGLYAAQKGAKRVCLTDFEDSLLENLNKSGEINTGEEIELRKYESRTSSGSGSGDGSGKRCVLQVAKLDWLEPEGKANREEAFERLAGSDKFEVILGSDLMYEMAPSLALPNIIRRHLMDQGTCLLAMKRRYEKILEKFLLKAKECNLSTSIKQVVGSDVSEEGSKLFGGGHHVIMLIRHQQNDSGSTPAGFELA